MQLGDVHFQIAHNSTNLKLELKHATMSSFSLEKGKRKNLFGATWGLISRVEIDNHRLSFEFGEADRFTILIFQIEIWGNLAFVHLPKNTET